MAFACCRNPEVIETLNEPPVLVPTTQKVELSTHDDSTTVASIVDEAEEIEQFQPVKVEDAVEDAVEEEKAEKNAYNCWGYNVDVTTDGIRDMCSSFRK